jgi:hypothetical protein
LSGQRIAAHDENFAAPRDGDDCDLAPARAARRLPRAPLPASTGPTCLSFVHVQEFSGDARL